MNIFYLLDTLCETSLLIQANSLTTEADGNPGSFYVNLVSRDLAKIVDYVVPEGREGLPNLMSVTQVHFITNGEDLTYSELRSSRIGAVKE